MVLERAIVGLPSASLLLQAFRAPAVDLAAILLHASHFGFFLLFGLALWHLCRDHFGVFQRSLVLLMLFGLVGYAVIPTAPPWVAAREPFELIPPLAYVAGAIYTDYVPELYGTFSTNPVAAMPSLHVAFPLVCAIVGWRAYGRRIRAVLGLYALGPPRGRRYRYSYRSASIGSSREARTAGTIPKKIPTEAEKPRPSANDHHGSETGKPGPSGIMGVGADADS